ncbi:MAG: bifunctional UDP-N-acetylglucosamine diphosphorylase/glucosamine-1-phosphate N-acetyltransferase GlmU [Desulfovermiculus sp.]
MPEEDCSETAGGRIGVVILAAGKGTRMKTTRPKVVHELLGLPMLWYVHQAVSGLIDARHQWTVVGYGREYVLSASLGYAGQYIHQAQQLGTGHALLMAWEALVDAGCEWCLVLNGDAPLVRREALSSLVHTCQDQDASLGFSSIDLDDPSGYGRVIRQKDGSVAAVVEEKDLFRYNVQGRLNEVNAGVYCLRVPVIGRYIQSLSRDNAQGEYYITELVDLCVQARETVLAVNSGRDSSFLGVNSPKELVACESLLQQRINASLLDKGVTLRNPDLVRISPLADIEPGVEITGPTEIYGQSTIQSGARIGSHVWMQDVHIAADAHVLEFSHLEKAQVDEECRVGPYARLRPGTRLQSRARVGNFVEVKKSVLASGCKANHLAYIGDSQVGEEANIGAGTITCNYDGHRKQETIIGKKAFIGSNTSLIAPITIGENSVVGAGSSLSKNVPDNTLALTRAKQKNMPRRMVGGKDEET